MDKKLLQKYINKNVRIELNTKKFYYCKILEIYDESIEILFEEKKVAINIKDIFIIEEVKNG